VYGLERGVEIARQVAGEPERRASHDCVGRRNVSERDSPGVISYVVWRDPPVVGAEHQILYLSTHERGEILGDLTPLVLWGAFCLDKQVALESALGEHKAEIHVGNCIAVHGRLPKKARAVCTHIARIMLAENGC
jgi:hypothetical protein